MPTIVSKSPQSAVELPQKTENRSPDLLNTCRRTSTRRKPVKDHDVLIENEPSSSLLLLGEAKIQTRQERRKKTFFSHRAKKTNLSLFESVRQGTESNLFCSIRNREDSRFFFEESNLSSSQKR
uniref:Uncharacterized protein n=1 Tax=Nelumbo nucifera TaxID=4432 RepID=A0A822Y0G2_NELNU|nr:TPA_asm: hypothetical protein HUJ06_026223 [Nelumbo nucifera]